MGSIQEPSSNIRLSRDYLGIYHLPKISNESVIEAERLLQKNHDEIHMFWRDANGHNHTAHNLLTSLALGANPAQLQQAYDDDARDQVRSKPAADVNMARSLYDDDVFFQHLSQGKHYSDYLALFEEEIDRHGIEATVAKYVFSHSRNAEALFARLMEGAFHSLIHLGLGLEFNLPSIVAEGLAQLSTDGTFGMQTFFKACEDRIEKAGSDSASKSLPELVQAVYDNETTRNGAHWDDFALAKITVGVCGRSREEMISIASQFRIAPERLHEKTAEMMSTAAYIAGAGQREGKPRKIDFFLMHDVTSSIFLSVLARQEFIPLADRVRLVEFKGRMDLVWYAACGAPKLQSQDIYEYQPETSVEWGWEALWKAINEMHDDGHVAKFARALRHGQDLSASLPDDSSLPVRGDAWLKLAKMAYDTNLNIPLEAKWIFFTGFDQPWTKL